MIASMGPRRRCRGRHDSVGQVELRNASFNGATTKVSWKAVSGTDQFTTIRELQWGHDEGVVEGGPPRGPLQNSDLRAVPREPATDGRPASIGCAGRPTEVRRSQAVPIRERGAHPFLGSHNDRIAKGLGARIARQPVFTTTPLATGFAQKNDTRKQTFNEVSGHGSR